MSAYPFEKLGQITAGINAGLTLEDILERVYQDFRGVIPYERIGLALVEEGGWARSTWVKSDLPEIHLLPGYRAALAGSSLERILETRQPRILNDLEAYLEHKPESISTRLILQEGIRASLTCPLIIEDKPVGFLFFSSVTRDSYHQEHAAFFQQAAGQLAVALERGQLVSALARQKEQIEQQNRDLIRLSELKNKLISVAAHDLRNPISLILSITDILMGPDAHLYASEQHNLLDTIARQAQHMINLINNLLDISAIESGGLKINPAPMSLDPWIEGIVQEQARLAEPKRTRIVLGSRCGRRVLADEARLRQAIENLISNAVKFSPPGSTVRLELEQIPHFCRLWVRDQGPGIKAEDRPSLFKPFSRLSTLPTGREKSTGLGLAIVKWIAQAHGGETGVEDNPGGGAAFWMTIPLVQEQ